VTARRVSTILIPALAVLAAGVYLGVPPAAADRLHSMRHAVARTTPLTILEEPTPVVRVPRYDTSGTYPQARGADLDLRKANAALRKAVLADQRAYAPDARKAARMPNRYRGVYRTSVDRRLLSASTVVVSALLPATELYPGGSLGKGWLAMTVRVPSGAPVRISQLFTDSTRGLRVLADEWKAQFRRANPDAWQCVRLHLRDYRPAPSNYRYFALTPRGIAVGFWQEPACNRLQATVSYALLRPYLSRLGKQLVDGVRRPG
jgi:hypothetical protein